MYCISDTQIDYILNDISARGVEMESLQQNLLDHVCCIIEQNLEENGDFENFYQKTIKTFYKDALWEIEEETIQLLTFKNYYTMKKIMIISGTVSAAIMSTGIFFKFMHWPGASLFIVLGIIISSLVFLPLVFTLKVKEKQSTKDKLILGMAILSGILISLAILFKVMHWPGANMMGTILLALILIFYMPLYFFSGIKNPEAKINTIVTTIIIIMGCGLFLTLLNTRPYIQDNANLRSNQYLQDSYEKMTKEKNAVFISVIKDSLSSKTCTELKNTCDELCNLIEAMKLGLISATCHIQTEKIIYADLRNMDNYDTPTQVLFDMDANPKQNILQIKGKLNELNHFVLSNLKQPDSGLIDLSDKEDLRTGAMLKWEIANFYRTPLNNVLRNLTQLQLNIRFIELTSAK